MPDLAQTMTRTLETQRLVLRPPQAGDAEVCIAFYLSERSKYVMGGARTRYAAWKTFAMEAGHWFLHGYGPWVVTLKGSNDALGTVGSWHPAEFPERELGWVLFSHEGEGIAYEAAVAARLDDYQTFGVGPLVSYIDPANTRSIALAERMGAVLDTDADRADPEDLVYRHPPLGALQ